MLRTILLISPVFVSLFWAIVLADHPKSHSVPRAFLGRFMLFPAAIYFTHFLYFAPLPATYPYFDAIFAYTSLLGFPMYYVYFRLLTVDKKFSLKAHGKYFIVAILVGTLYSVGVLLAPKAEYKVWLYNQTAYADNPHIRFLAAMRILGKITYLVQVVMTVIGNHFLLKKYGAKAEQYYSDIQDGKNTNARMLNYSMVALGIAAFIFGTLGRYSIVQHNWYIYSGWSVFSIILFYMGYMGFKQKPINPTFDSMDATDEQNQTFEFTTSVEQKIVHILEVEFEQKKVYLNSKLNIMDVVEAVGTNRTYVSLVINQKYNQNFCTFVNGYRIEELRRVIITNPEYTNETLAQCCGFGSLNSMKRAISFKTGLSMSDWRNQIIVPDNKLNSPLNQ